MKHILLTGLLTSTLALAGCVTDAATGTATLSPAASANVAKVAATPIPAAVVTDATVALAAFQAALGTLEVAAGANPALETKVVGYVAKAQPFVQEVAAGVNQVSTAQTLGGLAAQALADAAPFILAVAK